jgi:hypothetical protein
MLARMAHRAPCARWSMQDMDGTESRSIHRSAQTVIRGPSIGEWPLGMLCCMGGFTLSPPHSGRCAVLVCTHPASITSAGEP